MINEVTIVDYGMNNIQSVIQAFNYVGIKTNVATNSSELIRATHIVLPGVGSFPEGMKRIKNLGFDEMIKIKVNQKTKILGICLGMQMLFSTGSEFETCSGLNLINGNVVQIKRTDYIKSLPIIGWRETICLQSCKDEIFKKVVDKKNFYYLHSYHVIPNNKEDIIAYYKHDIENINAVIATKNIWAVQFHPEKSGEAGLNFLKAFSNL